jgi:stage II sporulation protein M
MLERNIPRHVVSLTGLFVGTFLAGFLAPIPGKRELFETLMDAFKPYLTLPPWKMFFAILINNSAKSFVVPLAGIMLGLIPLLAVAMNGYILGIAFLFASGEVGYLKAAKVVLPHGVLEIPAIILAASYGLWLGVTFFHRIQQRNLAGFGNQVRHAIRMFFLVAFPLFILAALIETVLISSMGGSLR